jgi:hypothetical protein
MIGATRKDFGSLAETAAGQATADCTPPPGGDCSVEYLRQLVFVHARQALTQAFTAGGPLTRLVRF